MLRLALLLAIAGNWLLFDAYPGLNWGIFATLLGGAIVAEQWASTGRVGRPTAALVTIATLFAWGAAAGAPPPLVALGLLAACGALALAVLARPDETAADLTIPRLVLAPLQAPIAGLRAAGGRLQGAVIEARREESLPVLRGIVLAVPVVGVFGLALSASDPVFAAWRDGAAHLVDDLPVARAVFGTVLFLGSLGALGVAARGPRGDAGAVGAPRAAVLRLGAVERSILLGSVVALFACFLVLQVSYLFGNAPAVAGSGVTFAEYARRGFGEITFVAMACTAMLALLRGGEEGPGDARVLRLLELVLVAEVALLLASAYRRTLLYEEAYGYTVARVWAQAFMATLGAGLLVLAREIAGAFDIHRLVRRQALLGAAMLLALTYWNHEAWITERNLERYERTGRLDLTYLTHDMSLAAVPGVLEAARRAGGVHGICADLRLRDRWADELEGRRRWFEWSAALPGARRALGSPPWYTLPNGERDRLLRGGCGRDWSVG